VLIQLINLKTLYVSNRCLALQKNLDAKIRWKSSTGKKKSYHLVYYKM